MKKAIEEKVKHSVIVYETTNEYEGAEISSITHRAGGVYAVAGGFPK